MAAFKKNKKGYSSKQREFKIYFFKWHQLSGPMLYQLRYWSSAAGWVPECSNFDVKGETRSRE